MITVHRHIMYIIFFAIGFFLGGTVFASADNSATFSVLGDKNFFYNETFSISFTCTGYKDIVIFNPLGIALGGVMCDPLSNSGVYDFEIQNLDFWLQNPEQYGTYTVLALDVVDGENYNYNDICIPTLYDGVTNDLSLCQIMHPTPVDTFTIIPILEQNIEFIDRNDVTPTDMLASVKQGTVETTGKLLPMLIFVGVPLAFVILGGISWIISDSVKNDKTGKKRKRDRKVKTV